MKREKELTIGVLNDYYGGLLTPLQTEMVRLYYDRDLSYAEIATEYGVTRQGARDVVERGAKKLKEYEEKLGLAAALTAVREELEELLPLAGGQLGERLRALKTEIEDI